MKDVFEQWSGTMEKMWEPWQQMMKDTPLMQKAEIPFSGNWSALLSAMRSTFDVNAAWWQTLVDHGEGLFFKMYKESPVYNQAVEQQIRDSWDQIRKAQATQQELIKAQFAKIESMLKEKEES
jgi:hypothetical protein